MIWDVITYNINDTLNMIGLDMCGYETSWGHQGWFVAILSYLRISLNLSITYAIWLYIKRHMKLNNNEAYPKI